MWPPFYCLIIDSLVYVHLIGHEDPLKRSPKKVRDIAPVDLHNPVRPPVVHPPRIHEPEQGLATEVAVYANGAPFLLVIFDLDTAPPSEILPYITCGIVYTLPVYALVPPNVHKVSSASPHV